MHNYHDAFGRFPPRAIYNKEGKSLLSWRVLLLPYLEGDHLYGRFHLDEPWDSPHNIELLKEMPKIYRQRYASTEADKSETLYQVLIGPGTIFGAKKVPSLADITNGDGASNTFLVVEAGESVPWTKPADLEIAPDQPLPSLGGMYRNAGWRPFARDLMNYRVFLAAFTDGHVQSLPKLGENAWSTESNIRALATWNGGEQVQLP